MVVETTAEWKLVRRRGQLVAALHEVITPELMRGTYVEGERRCGKDSCACMKGGRGHPARWISVKIDGRTRNCYVRAEQEEQVRKPLAAYRRLWRLLSELTEVNFALLRTKKGRRRRETK